MDTMTPKKHFDAGTLNRLAETEEIELDDLGSETDALIHPTTVWVVVVGEQVFVRSWKGNAGHWYQKVKTQAKAVVYLDGHPIFVQAVPLTDEATIVQVSDAYRRKYADDPFMPSMLRDEVLPTTLRLEPR